MIVSPTADPAELGRGRLTRWLPVFWQAPPDPAAVVPFSVTERTSPVRFLLGVIFSVKRFTVRRLCWRCCGRSARRWCRW